MTGIKENKSKYDQKFDQAYQKLNPEQKQAVDLIEGPVMVVAGPGTGKTQILATRIGNILKIQDTQAHNILCLTYTDSGAIAMRKRLVEIIGPEAHKIHIFTFHSFANQIIQENLGRFGNYRQLDLLSDLDKVEIFGAIISELPNDHSLKRLKGDGAYESKRLENLFNLMKKDHLTETQMLQRIDHFIEEMKEEDKFIAKRAGKTKHGFEYKKGDFRSDKFEIEVIDKFKDTQLAVKLFPKYIKKLDEKGKYDYQDMIRWVINEFENDELFLARYQEQYQYFLVDEFQDTNGSQGHLLELLIDFMDHSPNVFVVGDDDQAIYKFQGANMGNIIHFKQKYDPQIVVLKKNYRSNQTILDTAKNLIENNTNRLIHLSDIALDKNLKAEGNYKNDQTIPEILEFENTIQEEAYLAQLLINKYKNGERLNEIGVIYRKHAQIQNVIKYLELHGVPLHVKKRVNILKQPLIVNLLNMLFYIQSEYEKPNSEAYRLFELLHYHFFGINTQDIAKISLYMRQNIATSLSENELRNHKNESTDIMLWRNIISNKKLMEKLGVSDTEPILFVSALIDKWVADIANVTLQTLFENIINEGYVLRHLLQHTEKTWLLQVLSTFFDLIKEESERNPKIKLHEFLDIIDKMNINDIPIGINKVNFSEDGIRFMTAHSSKGLQFESVFIFGSSKDKWDKPSSTRYSYKLPNSVNAETHTNETDERRLFYVGITRAKKNLVISYSNANPNGKAIDKSQFVDEILVTESVGITKTVVPEQTTSDFQYQTMLKLNRKIKLIDHNLIDKVLQKYKLSVTGLNKYIKCPMSFYFDTILRIPTARSKNMGFGRAVHEGLDLYFQHLQKGEKVSVNKLLAFFERGMRNHRSHFTPNEYKAMTAHGQQILKAYYEERLQLIDNSMEYFTEEKLDHIEYKGVPIKGFLDLVILKNGNADVVDYKTGKYRSEKLQTPSTKNESGGDYWRQIVYYKILVDNDKKRNWNMVSGAVDFVEPDKAKGTFTKRKIVVKAEDVEIVGKQITDTWAAIHKHEFNQLCEDEKCYWCNFVRNDYVFSDELDLGRLEDDYQDN